MIGLIHDRNYLKVWIVVVLSILPTWVSAQLKTGDAVRLTGIILDADSRKEVPYVSVRISGTQYGTSSDNTGYFNLFINPGDTLRFSSIGYQDAAFVMPYTVGSNTYSLIQLMKKETLLLEEVVVFPWPTTEHIKQTFLDTQPPLDPMKELVKEVTRDVKEEVKTNTKSNYYYEQMRYQKLYELDGSIPPNNFLNPMRWADFLSGIKKKGVRQKEK